jgi:hypothetical protein
VTGAALARYRVDAGGMRHCGAVQAEGEPWPGNRTPPPLVGAVVVSLAIVLRCEVTRAAHRRSVCAFRER